MAKQQKDLREVAADVQARQRGVLIYNSTRASLGRMLDALPHNTTIRFNIGTKKGKMEAYFDVELNSQGELEIMGSDQIIIVPQVSNVIRVRVVR